MMHRVALLSALLPQLACVLPTEQLGEPNEQGASDSGSGSTSDATTDPGTASMTGAQEGTATTAPATSTDPTSVGSSSDDEGASEGCGLGCPDVGPIACDVWAQDCPDGEKCSAYADEGENAWDSLRCVPIAESPGDPGDPCTMQGHAISGYDDCDIMAMCFDVDEETLQGTCYALCHGSPDQPACDEGYTCVIANEGVITLCLPSCDPLAPECQEGHACYPFDGAYACAPEGESSGGYGDDCATSNCAPGLACINADDHADCASDVGCCTPYCDPAAPVCPEGSVCTTDGDPEVGFCTAP